MCWEGMGGGKRGKGRGGEMKWGEGVEEMGRGGEWRRGGEVE